VRNELRKHANRFIAFSLLPGTIALPNINLKHSIYSSFYAVHTLGICLRENADPPSPKIPGLGDCPGWDIIRCLQLETLNHINFISMKQRIVLFLLAAIMTTAAIAQNNNISKILNGPAFEELRVSGPATVELIESETPSIHIEGAFHLVNEVSISWVKNSLSISFPAQSARESLVVKVYVKGLKSLIAEENVKVISPQPLNSANLLITVNDVSSARIVNRGKTRVYNMGNVNVKTYPYGKDSKGF
jgi:hypothetical protein